MDKLKELLFDSALKYRRLAIEAKTEYENCFEHFKPKYADEYIKGKREDTQTLAARYNALWQLIYDADLCEEYEKYKKSKGD